MSGVLLIGYDVERIAGRVPGEKWVGRSLPHDTAETFLAAALRVHSELRVPATLFVVGCNIERLRPQLEACLSSGWFEIAQHTHEHYPLKTVLEESPDNIYLPGLAWERIEEQLARPVELLDRLLGVRCRGVTTPYSYYRGLGDRPDILAIIARLGMSYVRSYGRNSRDYFPLDWDVQPFWYARQGFPDLLETPMQGWIDAQWRREHGWENWPAYFEYLKQQVAHVAGHGLCWSHCQHDWTSVLCDEPMAWTRKFIEQAAASLEILTHFQFYERMQRLRSEALPHPSPSGAPANASAYR